MAEQPKKKVLLTPERTIEVADSLSKEGRLKLATAVKFRKEKEKAGTYANKYMSDKFLDSAANDANKDIFNAVKYRELAEDSKKKIPTPNTRKQIQDMEMMKEKIRQNSSDKSMIMQTIRKMLK